MRLESATPANLSSAAPKGGVVGAEWQDEAVSERRSDCSDDEDFSAKDLSSGCCGQRVYDNQQIVVGMKLYDAKERVDIQKLCSGARGRRSRKATGAEGGGCTIFALRGFDPRRAG
ncbi:hypothetical protein THAOC_23416 [Thalassiosira oceanica]|uniref:Uncharacterized protein n=1 Tax=Thalassiosira oceanica TaxID=159749 RepID=K0S701_THAOC|nr:hypothetical protein THAOC_23416 [Thalassiosira oceanica]|eukprot:EJK56656.1 hypothetical protein THAOC_23416 [Thalassiosira oceanica]